MNKAQAELPRVLAAAEKAYLAAPNQNKELNAFPADQLDRLRATPTTMKRPPSWPDYLVENKFDAKELNLMAGLAFFSTNDFDAGRQVSESRQARADMTQPGRPAVSGASRQVQGDVGQGAGDPRRRREGQRSARRSN